MKIKVSEREIAFKEAMELWKQGNKMICFELNGVKYALNAVYSEDKETDLIYKEINNAKWIEMIIKRE